MRTREEFDAVHIEGATFFTQELMHESRWLGSRDADHLRRSSRHAQHGCRRPISPATAWKTCARSAAASTRGARRSIRTCRATNSNNPIADMNDDLAATKIHDAIANPKNLGEMENADSVGTVGSADCGDMLRMWVKFKEEGRPEGHRPRDVPDLRLRDGHRRRQRGHGADRRERPSRKRSTCPAPISPPRSARCRR